ncbi:hypothetical protein PVAP13_9NG188773 [Panicum virgatum]|uniref:F-box domain-containing protein n=1 Tax=Panicum virgatum TaxID=38727 RepID=A0A8T0MH40_PANVG|nr:hypothetical protein PVAP13_9NG188773 [Panicum virgatum]
MPPRKRRRAFIAPPSPDQATVTTPRRPPEEEAEPPALPTLPPDLLPEIAARSDVTTLVRCAACCRALRRDILRPAFIRRVCREPDPGGAAVVPPCVLGFLHAYDKARMGQDQGRPPPPCFSAAHPATPGVASFFEKHHAPFAARTAGRSLLGDYEPLAASRNGLVVLRRRYCDRTAKLNGLIKRNGHHLNASGALA